jgi:uncharacterized membrane protein
MLLQSTVTIAAPARVVFDVLADVARWPEWSETMTRIQRLDQGPLVVGSRARVKQPRLRETVWTVTELEDGRGFSWVSRAPGVTTTGRHVVVPSGESAVVTLSIEHTGPLSGPVGLLTKGLTRRYLAMEGAGLKQLCEA